MKQDGAKTSETGFDLALFIETSRRVGRSLSAHRDLFEIGCILEDRLLLAQGATVGAFPAADIVNDLLAEGQNFIESSMFHSDLGDDAARLPPYLSAKQLRGMKSDFGRTEFDEALSFRQFEYRPSQSRSYDHFHRMLLFGADREWDELAGNLELDAEKLLRDYGSAATDHLNDIYESVLICSDLLYSRLGIPLRSADPWQVALGETHSTVAEAFLPKLSAENVDTALALIEEATTDLRKPKRSLTTRNIFEEVFRLRLLEIVQLPASVIGSAQPPSDLPKIPMRLSARTGFVAVQSLGPSMSWAVPLWRIAPADRRSLDRMAQAVAILAPVLKVLSSENGSQQSH
jgi:hypothetical protein